MIRFVLAVAAIYIVTCVGWMLLGGSIYWRTSEQDGDLRSRVGQLWGTPLIQKAPTASVSVPRTVENEEWDSDAKRAVRKRTEVIDTFAGAVVKSDVRADVHLDQRKKGLLWYSTYRVEVTAHYVIESARDKAGPLNVAFAFPSSTGQFDDFRFDLDGTPVPYTQRTLGALTGTIPQAAAASLHTLDVHYVSQGLDDFTYRFGDGIANARDFQMVIATDFDAIDFPGNTTSPTNKQRKGSGWELTWKYKNLISGDGVGIAMPKKLNPGPTAARISLFAPVSLGFFFFLTFVISVMRNLRIHPMHYFFVACSFFAFHLLLAYLVDHFSIHLAFAICAFVSIGLLTTYFRIVVGPRYAFGELMLAQLVYLVGFSYAFFFEGYTGLAVTITAIVTLFVVMQFTARVDWAEKFRPTRAST